MKKTIKNPHWINNARTVLSAQFEYEDGRVVEATISESDVNNPDLHTIKQQFSQEQLEQNTRRRIKEINEERERERLKQEAAALRKQQEELFAVKLKIFEIEEVKNSTNNALKARIRRSKSDLEATAWAAAVLLNEFNNANAPKENT